MADVSPFTLEQMKEWGLASLEVGISQWGNRGTGADATSGGIAYPQLSICGAEVHPKSMIEGFRLLWTSPQVPQPAIIQAPDVVSAYEFIVMRDKPFQGRLSGAITIRPLPQDYYADAYIAEGQQSTPLFGGAMVAPAVFDAPQLWASLHYRPELPRSAGARHHYRIGPTALGLSGFDVIDTVGAFPVAGRKNIRVLLTSVAVPSSPGSIARALNVQINGLAGNNTGVGIGLANRLQEYPIISVNVPAETTVPVFVPYTPHQWLIIKAQVEEQAQGGLSYRIDASDYP